MHRKLLVIGLLVLGCGRNPEESAVSQPAPPPAAMLARQDATLDESLRELEQELSTAMGTGIDGAGEENILRAEAITDRLLETQMPFSWLRSSAYSLDSYVRQIQALADRVVAEMRSNSPRDVVEKDARELRGKVIWLRRALAQGGGAPPPSLDSLLAAHPADSVIISEGIGE